MKILFVWLSFEFFEDPFLCGSEPTVFMTEHVPTKNWKNNWKNEALIIYEIHVIPIRRKWNEKGQVEFFIMINVCLLGGKVMTTLSLSENSEKKMHVCFESSWYENHLKS